MATLEVDWDCPEVFLPAFGSERYIGLKGGRGSGKSRFAAQLMVARMLEGKSIICIREVQSSIADSSKKEIEDRIVSLGLSGLFDIIETEIRCIPSGARCIFRGMQSHNAGTVKSLAGFDIAWFEEAQTASHKALDLLEPTIRKPGSQLIFTWNPENPTDAVEVFFNRYRNAPDGCLLIHANYYDNPWFWDTSLVSSMRNALETDQDRYEHIWLGQFLSQASMQLIPRRIVEEARKREAYTDLSDLVVLGVDVARFGDDDSIIYTRRGMDARSDGYIRLKKVDTMTLAGRVKERADELNADAVFVDETGVGAGVVDRCRQLGMDNVIGVNFGSSADRQIDGQAKAANKRAEMWLTMRSAIASGLALPDNDELAGELTAPLYSYDAHNAILLEKKPDMKKRLLRSPDIADALALTYAYPVTARRVMAAHLAQTATTYDPWS